LVARTIHCSAGSPFPGGSLLARQESKLPPTCNFKEMVKY
jgi:hypothetical protein